MVDKHQHKVQPWALSLGAQPDAEGTRFKVWASNAQRVEVVVFQDGSDETSSTHLLTLEDEGYFEGYIKGVMAGARYKYRLDGGDSFPDPASRYQPQGVHGPSQVVDPRAFTWTDQNWHGIQLEEMVIYEVHVGTATEGGTFDALIARLETIRQLGVTAIGIMPVADFPGERNWGYDGVYPFAPSRAYGGPEGLRRLVDAAHAHGLAVILDAVFNHLGPDGNYFSKFSTDYFEGLFETDWGPGLNYANRYVRRFFADNARYWAHEYHVDGLRLDAIHAIRDGAQPHILTEIAAEVHDSLPPDRHFIILAEDVSNDPHLVHPFSGGGFGLDGIFADDFHHEVRVAITGQRLGYYMDYCGTASELVKTLEEGWFYTGQFSKWLKMYRGRPAIDVPPPRFVHFIENHDQVGNRPFGERLNHVVTRDAYRAASSLLLLSPYTPLLFMGQEWAASTPFPFFTDHNSELGDIVTNGRLAYLTQLFRDLPREQVPKPQDQETFLRAKLQWEERNQPSHSGILRLYRDLLALRRQQSALCSRDREAFEVSVIGPLALVMRRLGLTEKDTLLVVANLGGQLKIDLHANPATTPPSECNWAILLDTEDLKYEGRGDTRLVDGTILDLSGPRVLLLEIDRTL